MSAKELTPVRKVALAAMLLAINVVSTRLLGLAQAAPMFAFNRLGIGIALIVFSSISLGPFYGALVGVAGDAIGWVILGQWTGAFNVYLSAYYALIGIVPWALCKLLVRHRPSKALLAVFCAVYAALFAVFLGLVWGTALFNGKLVTWGFEVVPAKAFISVLSSLLFLGSLAALLALRRKKELGEEIGFLAMLCLAVEFITIFLKPLAFYLYCLTFLGADIESAWHISYSTLVLLAILFAFIDLIINVAMLRLLLWLFHKRVRTIS